MILVDTNSLILIVLGLMDPRLINTHSKTSIYEEEDFNHLMIFIGDLKNIIVTPNILTEVDNLLNNFSGNLKYPYINAFIRLIKESSETYIRSTEVEAHKFFIFGLTDSIILELAPKIDCLITSDSKLSDYATGIGIRTYDLIAERNRRFLQ
ncbi:hypothetical protein [Daejeonella sp.]|uniref:hypothetical protein n=1 Tax=Daejeonella sp. TaxID=2805397 RepID=UPI0030BFD379